MKFFAIFLGPIVLLGCMSVVSAGNKELAELIMRVFDHDGDGIINKPAEVAAFNTTLMLVDKSMVVAGTNYYFVINALETKNLVVSDVLSANMAYANQIVEAFDNDNSHVIDGAEEEAFRKAFDLKVEEVRAIDGDSTDGGITKMEILAALTSKKYANLSKMVIAGNVVKKYDTDYDGGISGSSELSAFGKALGLNPLQSLAVFGSTDDIKITLNEVHEVSTTGPTIMPKLIALSK